MTPPKPDGVFDLGRELSDELVTHTNIKQELVITTVDKLKLCLIEHKEHLRSRREWMGPVGLFIALVAALLAADFAPVLGLDAATWRALFLLGAIFAGFLTIALCIRAAVGYKKGGVDAFIDRIAARSAGEVGDELYATMLADLLKGISAKTSEPADEDAEDAP